MSGIAAAATVLLIGVAVTQGVTDTLVAIVRNRPLSVVRLSPLKWPASCRAAPVAGGAGC